MKPKMKAMKYEQQDGRTILTDAEGLPVLIGILTRPATTAHARIKASLVVAYETPEGETKALPLPVAMIGRKPTFEFRLEQN